jgi:hypothetical protein
MIDKATQQPIILTIKGIEFKLSPFTLQDWGDVIGFVRNKKIKELQEFGIDLAIKEANKVSLDNYAEWIMLYVETIIMIIHVAVRRNHPEWTFDKLNNFLDMQTADASKMFEAIMGISIPEDKEADQKKTASQ